MSAEIRPTRIQASRSKAMLTIEWSDGQRCEYPLAGLRAACPCAECRGGHENMPAKGDPGLMLIPLSQPHSNELDRLEPVGNYALQPIWSDGHAFGIYTWEYLRQLCPA
jgi:DUF971 family protein